MKNPRGKNKFHIYPKRRFPEKKNDPDNITLISIEKHVAYHELFGLMTPEEIVDYLNGYFWDGKFRIEIRRRNEKEDTL